MDSYGNDQRRDYSFIKSQGADLCGIADLSDKNDYIKKPCGEYFSSFPRAVSFAFFYPKEVLQRQLEGPTRNYFNTVATMTRDIDSIWVKAASVLQRAEFRAFPIPASDYRPSLNTKGLHQTVAEAEDSSALRKIEQEIMGDCGHRILAAKAGLGLVVCPCGK